MRFLSRDNTVNGLLVHAIALLCAVAVVPAAIASDLPAASDGDHLWLVTQSPAPANNQDAGPQLKIHHLPANTDRYIATKLDPIAGELMPRGVAAGDGRLLLVTKARQLITIRPVWSELLRQSVYQKRTLTPLPEGCTLVSLAMGDRGPWALVKVESRELLERLDEQDKKKAKPTEQQLLNRALGMPEDFDWGKPADVPEQDAPAEDESVEETPAAEDAAPQGDDDTPIESSDADDAALSDTEAYAQAVIEPTAEPALPAYRLIYLRSRQWVASPLPDNFSAPGEVAMVIRPGDGRPTLLVDSNSSFRRIASLVRYNPVAPVDPIETDADTESSVTQAESQNDAMKWDRVVTGMQLPPGRRWAAGLVNGQIVIARERYRTQDVASIETFHLRDDRVHGIGSVNISTGVNARWALMPMQDDIGLIASPPPPAADAPSNQLPTIAMLAGLSLHGQPLIKNAEGVAALMPISEKQPSIMDGNADLTIQIIAFIAAMFMMVMFYRRAPQQSQIDLPEHLVLASFGRRAMAGMIDLAPGFFLASLIYGVTISEIVLQFWPGNGVEKAFAAMRPGFVVIGVTLVHTVICEFILARSLGKILCGLYVADLNGKPAPPAPCLGRALSRAFELFAPLMILVAIISPARQRLGDILAKTIVVMRKPEPIKFDLDDEQ